MSCPEFDSKCPETLGRTFEAIARCLVEEIPERVLESIVEKKPLHKKKKVFLEPLKCYSRFHSQREKGNKETLVTILVEKVTLETDIKKRLFGKLVLK